MLPKIFLDCQNANMKLAQLSDDNVDTVRTWSLTLPDTTHTLIFPVIWLLSCSSFVELLRKFVDLIHILFLFPDCGMFLSPRHGASSCLGWRDGLRTWRVAASILYKRFRTDVKCWSCSFVFYGVANKLSTRKCTMWTYFTVGGATVLDSTLSVRFLQIRGIPRISESSLAS